MAIQDHAGTRPCHISANCKLGVRVICIIPTFKKNCYKTSKTGKRGSVAKRDSQWSDRTAFYSDYL